MQNQNARVATDGARDCGALLLPAGKRNPAFAHDRLIALGKILNVSIEVRNSGGLSHLFFSKLRQSKRDVAANGFAKKVSVLRHEADRAAQRRQWPFAERPSV